MLVSLAQDLPTVWHAPTTDMRLKQRIVRILIQEIVANVDEAQEAIVLVIHWRWSTLRTSRQAKRNRSTRTLHES